MSHVIKEMNLALERGFLDEFICKINKDDEFHSTVPEELKGLSFEIIPVDDYFRIFFNNKKFNLNPQLFPQWADCEFKMFKQFGEPCVSFYHDSKEVCYLGKSGSLYVSKEYLNPNSIKAKFYRETELGRIDELITKLIS